MVNVTYLYVTQSDWSVSSTCNVVTSDEEVGTYYYDIKANIIHVTHHHHCRLSVGWNQLIAGIMCGGAL